MIGDVGEDEGSVHGHLLLGDGLVAVAPADGVAGVRPAIAVLPGNLVLHVPPKHTLVGRHEGEAWGLELWGEEGREDSRGAGVVGGEAVVGRAGHVLLPSGDGVECLQSICCSPQEHVLQGKCWQWTWTRGEETIASRQVSPQQHCPGPSTVVEH